LPPNRDASVDALRGLAVFTMIASNLAAEVMSESHPLLLRLYGSFAAAFFIAISGMMVYQMAKAKGYHASHFLARGASILLVGVLIDVFIWRIVPFMTVDVLYLIGVSLPIAYLFTRTNKTVRWLAIALIFLATPILQNVLGYTSYPTELTLTGQLTVIVPNQTSIINHWIVDGWFPIFPWLGFSLLGINIAEWRLDHGNPAGGEEKTIIPLLSALSLFSGIAIWILYPGPLLVRAGYGELFYPPTIGYILTASGLFVLLLLAIDKSRSASVYNPFEALGESPLFIYIIHLALIEYVFAAFVPNETLQAFLLSYAILTLIMGFVAYCLRAIKTKQLNLPRIIRFLIGS